jgi:hypothetical protein
MTVFLKQVNDLTKEGGHWSTDIADALPVALANILQTYITIYTSRPSQPVYTVVPSLVEATTHELLRLAYVYIPGCDYYGGCNLMNRTSSADNGTHFRIR